jgi:hypothetical protein
MYVCAPDFTLANGTAMNDVVDFTSIQMPWFGSAEAESAAHLSAFEPFVDERVVARFLQIAPRRVLEMARKKEIPAHPIGRTRKTWRFRMSEVDAHFRLRSSRNGGAPTVATTPVTQERKHSWARVQ